MVYDIGVGRYAVSVDVGDSYKTRRQKSVDSQLQFLKLLPPEISHLFIDLVTANMDWPQAKEFAARAKKLLPPQLQDDAQNPLAQVEQLKANQAQMAQELQLLQAELQKAQQIIATKQIEMQGKMQIEKMKMDHEVLLKKMELEAGITEAEITAKTQDTRERRQFEMDMWNLTHSSAHETAMQAQQHGHEQDQAAAAQAAQQQQAEQEQQQEPAAPDNFDQG